MQLFLGALLLALNPLSQQGTMEFYCPGATVDHVLKQIHDETGDDLRCNASIANEVLIIDAHHVTKQELLDKVAGILGATWQGNTLTRSGKAWQAFQDREYQNKRKFIDGFLSKKRNEAAKLVGFTDAEADSGVHELLQATKELQTDPRIAEKMQESAEKRTPASRLLTRLLAQSSADEVAKMEIDEVAVYSTHPTQMQKAFPADIGPLLATFMDEQNRWAAAAKAAQSEKVAGQGAPQFAALASKPALVLLHVRNELGTLSFSIELADDKGKQLVSAGDQIDTGRAVTPPNTQPKPLDKLVAFSAISQSFLGMLRSMMMGPKKGDTVGASDPKLREFLENPQDHEPLQLAVADAFVSVARDRGLNLIANPPDDSLFNLIFSPDIARKGLSLQQVEDAAARLGVEFDSGGGWLQVPQLTPIANQRFRFDRTALGKLMKVAIEKHHISLDQLGDYAATLHCKFEESLSVLFFLTLVPDLASVLGGRTSDSDFFKVYGLLTDEQKAQLAGGKIVAYHSLSAHAQRELAQLVYWGMGGGIQFDNSVNYAEWQNSAYSDPTICAGNGIPDDAPLKANVRDETVVFASASTPDPDQPWPQPENPEQLASAIIERQKPTTYDSRLRQPFDQFRLGSVRHWDFMFSFAKGVSLTRQLVDINFDPTSTPLTYDQLPQDFKARVQAALKRIPAKQGGKGGDPLF